MHTYSGFAEVDIHTHSKDKVELLKEEQAKIGHWKAIISFDILTEGHHFKCMTCMQNDKCIYTYVEQFLNDT